MLKRKFVILVVAMIIVTSMNVFAVDLFGKTAQECSAQEYLYHIAYWEHSTADWSFLSPSPYYYDSTKTVYFYPVVSESDYMSFMALSIDDLSNCSDAVVLLDFMQFQIQDGQWKPVKFGNWTARDLAEKETHDTVGKNVKSDIDALFHKGISLDDHKGWGNVMYPEWFLHGFFDYGNVPFEIKSVGVISKDYYSAHGKSKSTTNNPYKSMYKDMFYNYELTYQTALTNFGNNPGASEKMMLQKAYQQFRDFVVEENNKLNSQFMADSIYPGLRDDVNRARTILSAYPLK